MATPRRRARSLPEPVQIGALEQGDVDVIRTKAGDVYFRPHIRPRAWDRLGEEGQFLLAGLQERAALMSKLDGEIEHLTHELRNIGASWDVIAWSLGMSANGLRKRYGLSDD